MSLFRVHAGLALALCAAIAGCASDQAPRRHEHGRFAGHADRDGGARRFGGGATLFISPAGQPFRAGPDDPYPVAQWFAAADADHDGRLTRSEFRQDAERFFRALDLNHDAIIDGVEISAYEHNVAPEILSGIDRGPVGDAGPERRREGAGEGRRGGGRRGGGRRSSGGEGRGESRSAPERLTMQGAMRFSLIASGEPVAAADTNFDGRVTLGEFLEAADRRFAELDKSGAGYLTLEGLPKTPVQEMAERRRARRAD